LTIDPAAIPPGAEEGGAGHAGGQPPERRPRYGRRRGHIPVGDSFVSRLGPSADEPFASIDDVLNPVDATPPPPDTPVEALRFVALDCETTGQTPHRLVELGAVAFTLERHLISFETLVHSTDRINPYAKRIHGISSETLGGAPPVDRVLERFRHFIAGAVLVEHSADAFDTRLIARTLREPLDNDNIDTSRLAAKIWGLRDTIGLERLCQQLNVHHRRPHHALADAEATAECFIALVELGREQFGWNTLGDLLADGQPPPPRPPAERRTPGTPGAPDGVRRRRRGGRRRRPAPSADGETSGGESAV
jgi:DNA polymerase III epsilon subunit-like protein